MNAKVLKKRHIGTQMEALISMILIPMFIIYINMFNTYLFNTILIRKVGEWYIAGTVQKWVDPMHITSIVRV
jgi:hypothetical protein